MNFQDKKAVIFDLDGTLLDTLTDLKNSVNEALCRNGLPPRTEDEIRSFVGNGMGMLAARAIPEGKNHPLYDKILADTRAVYARRCRETTKPYAGIPELLHALHEKGYLLAVVSNKPDHQVKTLCKDFFDGLIAAAIGQKDGVRLKPAPDPLFSAMEILQCQPEDTVYAGDSDVDILTAKNAGIPCISVLWGFRSRDFLTKSGGNCFAESPAEMIHFF